MTFSNSTNTSDVVLIMSLKISFWVILSGVFLWNFVRDRQLGDKIKGQGLLFFFKRKWDMPSKIWTADVDSCFPSWASHCGAASWLKGKESMPNVTCVRKFFGEWDKASEMQKHSVYHTGRTPSEPCNITVSSNNYWLLTNGWPQLKEWGCLAMVSLNPTKSIH